MLCYVFSHGHEAPFSVEPSVGVEFLLDWIKGLYMCDVYIRVLTYVGKYETMYTYYTYMYYTYTSTYCMHVSVYIRVILYTMIKYMYCKYNTNIYTYIYRLNTHVYRTLQRIFQLAR